MIPVALIAGLALSAGKAIAGGIQAAKGKKDLQNLLKNRPKYNIPEAYMKALGIYQNLAAGEMPGMKRYEEMIGQSTARAMTSAERGAISSNVYQGAVEQSQDKELQALQQLAQMGVQYKTQAMQNLAGAQQMMGAQQEQQFEYNVNRPWEIQANMAAGNKQAGAQNLFGGLNEGASTLMNYAGTKYYVDAMKATQTPQTSKVWDNPNQTFSQPIGGGYDSNLMNTASNTMNKDINFSAWDKAMEEYNRRNIYR